LKTKNILVKDTNIAIKQFDKVDFISLTDIARSKNPDEPKDVVKNWLRSRTTIEFLGLWEQINNDNFKGVEFDSFKNEAGLNSFTLSPTKWVNRTNAIGIISKAGRYGGTYAHKDIAFEFASWISAEFKLFLIKEFQIIVLSNLESLNSLLINQNLSQSDRLIQLNEIAISQMKLLVDNKSLKKLIDAR